MKSQTKLTAAATVLLKWIFTGMLIGIFATPTQFTTGAYIFSSVPIAFALLLLGRGVRLDGGGKKITIAAALLTALFLAQLSCTQLFANFHTSIVIVNQAVVFVLAPCFIAFLALASFISIYAILTYAVKKKEWPKDESPLKKIPFLRLYYFTIPIAAVTILYLLSSALTYEYPDIIRVWEEAAANEWSAWHTIGYSLFVKIFSLGAVAHNDFQMQVERYMVALAQGICWIYISNYAVYTVYNTMHSKKLCALYSAAATLLITPAVYTGVMLKDTMFCMCMLLFVCALVNWLGMGKRCSAGHMLILILSGVGTSVFRHAGWVCVLGMLAACCIYSYVKKSGAKKTLAALLVIVCVTGFINEILPRFVLHAEENPPYVAYTIPLYMVGAISEGVEDLPEEDVAVMEKLMPRQTWNEAMEKDKYFADSVSRDWGVIGENIEKINDPTLQKEILQLNLKFVLKYPYQYLCSFFDISSILWEVGRPSDGYEWTPLAPLEDDIRDYELGEAALIHTAGREVTRSISDATFRNPILNPIYWRGGFWLFALVLAATLLILKKQYKYLIAAGVPLVNAALLFLSIPAQDPRYVLFLMECGLLLTVFSFFIEKD